MTLLLPEILRKHGLTVPNKRRDYGLEEEPVIRAVIDELAAAVDEVLAKSEFRTPADGNIYDDI